MLVDHGVQGSPRALSWGRRCFLVLPEKSGPRGLLGAGVRVELRRLSRVEIELLPNCPGFMTSTQPLNGDQSPSGSVVCPNSIRWPSGSRM
jgi:hypothetical protein